MKIIDNFLDKEYHEDIYNRLMGWGFPWFFQDTLTHGVYNLDAIGFNHWLTADSEPLFIPLVKKMQSAISAPDAECIRLRADMTTYNPTGYKHGYHVDSQQPHIVCIYYVNTSDGNTCIRGHQSLSDEHEVEPIANRLLIFNGKLEHTGHSPKRHKNRILINANFTTSGHLD